MRVLVRDFIYVGLPLLVLLSCSVRAEETILRNPVKVTFSVDIASYRPMGIPPEAIGIAGNRPPLGPEKRYPPTLVLREVKGLESVYSGEVEFPKGTPKDVAFLVLCRVDGLWLREPNSMGIPHLVLLDPTTSSQTVSLRYDSTGRRIVASSKTGPRIDDFAAAALSAKSGNEAAAQEYSYWNAIAFIKSGRMSDAQKAYSDFQAGVLSSGKSSSVHDRFPIVYANALARSGKVSEAVKALRIAAASNRDEDFRAESSLQLARLLERSGEIEEARTFYAGVAKRPGAPRSWKDESDIALACSFGKDKTPALTDRARNLLLSVLRRTSDTQHRRQALISLADIERRSNRNTAALAALQEASRLGTVQQRLAASVQCLEIQRRLEDFSGMHTTCSWILNRANPGRHKPHVLWLDALALKMLGREAESKARFKVLDSAYASSPYTRYAAMTLSSLPASNFRPDSLAKGGQVR